MSAEPTYDEVVNIVEAGADPTGEEPIGDVVEEHNDDDTLIKFPEGRYLVNDLDFYGRENFALKGEGDATLVPGPEYDVDVWIGGADVRDFRFEGFTLDNTADGHHPTIGFTAHDGLVVKDIHKKGYHGGENTAFGFSITDVDGTGYIENLRMPDGSEPQSAVGVYVNTRGDLTFRDCHVEGFGNNGLYASTSFGPVHVEGGVYKNNDIAQVRLGSAGSSVTNATIAADEPRPNHDNRRGIRIADGPGPVTIDSCDVVMERGPGGGGVVGAFSGGSFTLTNSRIYVGPEYHVVGSDGASTSFGVYVDEPTGVEDPGTRTIENTSITGGGEYRGAAVFRRDNNHFNGVCVHQTGESRDGLVFTEQSANNTLTDSTINVTGRAIAGRGQCDASGVSYDGTCATPDSVGDSPSEDSTSGNSGPPIPWGADDATYGVMGTHAGNPTATVYGNFKCPYTRGFVGGNLETIVSEFVETGDLNVRYRDLAFEPGDPDDPFIYDGQGNDLVSRVALGVWDFEPESYWQFFDHVFSNQSNIDWGSLDDLTRAMEDAGVRNSGKVRVYVDAGWYGDAVHRTTQAASDAGISFVPQLELDGDVTAPHHETGAIVDWIEARL